MRRIMLILTACSLFMALSGSVLAGTVSVSFFFDPADFYEFHPLGPGGADQWSFDGGMFKLHEIYGQESDSLTTLRSWQAADRPSLDAWKASLGTGEGIGFFNIDMSQTSNGQVWGQTMPPAISIDAVYAPSGWTGIIDGSNAGWSADTSSDYVLPGVPAGKFGFTMTMDDSFVMGADYTIWFGGMNYTDFTPPSVTFDSNWGGDANEFTAIDGTPGSGFEATLRLTAIPEPSSIALFFLGIGAVLVEISRRRRG
ncbi:MAG: PEP-CTERM sorting domain-containing protein [Pirellulales bacterium]|nr:PEP-CTERM sorting domain-containing protein [Pirellulales bacterium]